MRWFAGLLILLSLNVHAQSCDANVFENGGFELEANEAWVSFSSGDPVIRQDENLARTGSGVAVMESEPGEVVFKTLEQSAQLPEDAQILLSFWLAKPLCSGNNRDTLELVIGGVVRALIDISDGAPSPEYTRITYDLSLAADGSTSLVGFRTTALGDGGLTQWLIDDVCLEISVAEGEGEGEGEGAEEGEGMPDGEGEGDGEGSPEGEGEGSETCELAELTLEQPMDGATLYAGDNAGALSLELRASTDCSQATEEVRFFFRRETDSDFNLLTTDDSAPYTANFSSFGSGESAAQFRFRAEAVDADDDRFADEAEITFQNTDGLDSDLNGLPDAPFSTLDSRGDAWLQRVTLAGATAAMVTSASALYGEDGEIDADEITLRITNPENPGQRIVVTADASMLRDDEVGLLVMQAASDLPSLVGPVSEDFRRPPAGNLGSDGLYVSVFFLVSDDGGASFETIASSRLTARPMLLSMEGLPLESEKVYSLRRHPAEVITSGGRAIVQPDTGSWQAVTGADVDAAAGTAEADLTQSGVFSAFTGDPGSPCVGPDCGGGLSPGIWYLILFALGILGLVDGGEGGGGPCFVATAAYGTPLAAQVDVLRNFRDEHLLAGHFGSVIADMYYRISPPLADWVAQWTPLALLVRLMLVPLLLAVQYPWLPVLLLACWHIRLRHLRGIRK